MKYNEHLLFAKVKLNQAFHYSLYFLIINSVPHTEELVNRYIEEIMKTFNSFFNKIPFTDVLYILSRKLVDVDWKNNFVITDFNVQSLLTALFKFVKKEFPNYKWLQNISDNNPLLICIKVAYYVFKKIISKTKTNTPSIQALVDNLLEWFKTTFDDSKGEKDEKDEKIYYSMIYIGIYTMIKVDSDHQSFTSEIKLLQNYIKDKISFRHLSPYLTLSDKLNNKPAYDIVPVSHTTPTQDISVFNKITNPEEFLKTLGTNKKSTIDSYLQSRDKVFKIAVYKEHLKQLIQSNVNSWNKSRTDTVIKYDISKHIKYIITETYRFFTDCEIAEIAINSLEKYPEVLKREIFVSIIKERNQDGKPNNDKYIFSTLRKFLKCAPTINDLMLLFKSFDLNDININVLIQHANYALQNKLTMEDILKGWITSWDLLENDNSLIILYCLFVIQSQQNKKLNIVDIFNEIHRIVISIFPVMISKLTKSKTKSIKYYYYLLHITDLVRDQSTTITFFPELKTFFPELKEFEITNLLGNYLYFLVDAILENNPLNSIFRVIKDKMQGSYFNSSKAKVWFSKKLINIVKRITGVLSTEIRENLLNTIKTILGDTDFITNLEQLLIDLETPVKASSSKPYDDDDDKDDDGDKDDVTDGDKDDIKQQQGLSNKTNETLLQKVFEEFACDTKFTDFPEIVILALKFSSKVKITQRDHLIVAELLKPNLFNKQYFENSEFLYCHIIKAFANTFSLKKNSLPFYFFLADLTLRTFRINLYRYFYYSNKSYFGFEKFGFETHKYGLQITTKDFAHKEIEILFNQFLTIGKLNDKLYNYPVMFQFLIQDKQINHFFCLYELKEFFKSKHVHRTIYRLKPIYDLNYRLSKIISFSHKDDDETLLLSHLKYIFQELEDIYKDKKNELQIQGNFARSMFSFKTIDIPKGSDKRFYTDFENIVYQFIRTVPFHYLEKLKSTLLSKNEFFKLILFKHNKISSVNDLINRINSYDFQNKTFEEKENNKLSSSFQFQAIPNVYTTNLQKYKTDNNWDMRIEFEMHLDDIKMMYDDDVHNVSSFLHLETYSQENNFIAIPPETIVFNNRDDKLVHNHTCFKKPLFGCFFNTYTSPYRGILETFRLEEDEDGKKEKEKEENNDGYPSFQFYYEPIYTNLEPEFYNQFIDIELGNTIETFVNDYYPLFYPNVKKSKCYEFTYFDFTGNNDSDTDITTMYINFSKMILKSNNNIHLPLAVVVEVALLNNTTKVTKINTLICWLPPTATNSDCETLQKSCTVYNGLLKNLWGSFSKRQLKKTKNNSLSLEIQRLLCLDFPFYLSFLFKGILYKNVFEYLKMILSNIVLAIESKLDQYVYEDYSITIKKDDNAIKKDDKKDDAIKKDDAMKKDDSSINADGNEDAYDDDNDIKQQQSEDERLKTFQNTFKKIIRVIKKKLLIVFDISNCGLENNDTLNYIDFLDTIKTFQATQEQTIHISNETNFQKYYDNIQFSQLFTDINKTSITTSQSQNYIISVFSLFYYTTLMMRKHLNSKTKAVCYHYQTDIFDDCIDKLFETENEDYYKRFILQDYPILIYNALLKRADKSCLYNSFETDYLYLENITDYQTPFEQQEETSVVYDNFNKSIKRITEDVLTFIIYVRTSNMFEDLTFLSKQFSSKITISKWKPQQFRIDDEELKLYYSEKIKHNRYNNKNLQDTFQYKYYVGYEKPIQYDKDTIVKLYNLFDKIYKCDVKLIDTIDYVKSVKLLQNLEKLQVASENVDDDDDDDDDDNENINCYSFFLEVPYPSTIVLTSLTEPSLNGTYKKNIDRENEVCYNLDHYDVCFLKKEGIRITYNDICFAFSFPNSHIFHYTFDTKSSIHLKINKNTTSCFSEKKSSISFRNNVHKPKEKQVVGIKHDVIKEGGEKEGGEKDIKEEGEKVEGEKEGDEEVEDIVEGGKKDDAVKKTASVKKKVELEEENTNSQDPFASVKSYNSMFVKLPTSQPSSTKLLTTMTALGTLYSAMDIEYSATLPTDMISTCNQPGKLKKSGYIYGGKEKTDDAKYVNCGDTLYQTTQDYDNILKLDWNILTSDIDNYLFSVLTRQYKGLMPSSVAVSRNITDILYPYRFKEENLKIGYVKLLLKHILQNTNRYLLENQQVVSKDEPPYTHFSSDSGLRDNKINIFSQHSSWKLKPTFVSNYINPKKFIDTFDRFTKDARLVLICNECFLIPYQKQKRIANHLSVYMSPYQNDISYNYLSPLKQDKAKKVFFCYLERTVQGDFLYPMYPKFSGTSAVTNLAAKLGKYGIYKPLKILTQGGVDVAQAGVDVAQGDTVKYLANTTPAKYTYKAVKGLTYDLPKGILYDIPNMIYEKTIKTRVDDGIIKPVAEAVKKKQETIKTNHNGSFLDYVGTTFFGQDPDKKVQVGGGNGNDNNNGNSNSNSKSNGSDKSSIPIRYKDMKLVLVFSKKDTNDNDKSDNDKSDNEIIDDNKLFSIKYGLDLLKRKHEIPLHLKYFYLKKTYLKHLETYLIKNSYWKFNSSEIKLLFPNESEILGYELQKMPKDNEYLMETFDFKKDDSKKVNDTNKNTIYYILLNSENLTRINQQIKEISKLLFDTISEKITDIDNLVNIDISKENTFYKNNIDKTRKHILNEFHMMEEVVVDDETSNDFALEKLRSLKLNIQYKKKISSGIQILTLLKENEASFVEIELIHDVVVKYQKHSSQPLKKASVLSTFPLTKRFYKLKKEMKLFYDVVYNMCILQTQKDVDELLDHFTKLEIYRRFQKATRDIRADPSKWIQLKTRFPSHSDEKVQKLILGVYMFNDFF